VAGDVVLVLYTYIYRTTSITSINENNDMCGVEEHYGLVYMHLIEPSPSILVSGPHANNVD
jgi:hypothetical protein